MDPYIGQVKDVVLGQDFLTWLWYASEYRNGLFETKDGRQFTLRLEQRVSVQGGEGESLETATVSGAMSSLKEARIGLGTGKKVTRALVVLEDDPEEWRVTLKAEDFSFSSLKTPAIEAGKDEDDDPDAKFLEKIYLIERCLDCIDSVYAEFLNLRFSREWPEEISRFRSWLAREQ